MKNRETSLSEHCRDAIQTNSIEFESKFQAAHIFAKSKYTQKCAPPSGVSNSKGLSELINKYDGNGLPSIELAEKLAPYTNKEDVLGTSDDIGYIESCVKRYSRGIPIHLGRLMKCQEKLKYYEEVHEKLVEQKVIVRDGCDIVVSNLHQFLAPSDWIRWPKNQNGELVTDAYVLKNIPIQLARELYQALTFAWSKNLLKFNVNHKGRHYEYCNPFGASSGRETTKGCSFVYLPCDLRHYLLYPKKGNQIFILDFCSQEPACVAAMCGDRELWKAYQRGDLYEALKARDRLFTDLSRDTFKVLCISHLYGITPSGISKKFGVTKHTAVLWDRTLRKIMHKVNVYLDSKVKQAFEKGYADVFGFRRTVAADTRTSSIRNFFVQAVCAYMLRKICLKLEQLNIPLIFSVHDCFAIEVPANDEETKPLVAQVMADVSESILGQGYRLRSDCEYHKKNIK
ncbi:DNA polymerase I-3'-5' exonuclease and polymerase domains [Moritella viscosa]|uniref:DNA polymerase I-3'-5' exonuclease and polymerase domains n=1 Tax=Moritella viscosa TaxID=80854 RepID=A0A1L0AV25_9GAMM|nr:DNA polymerase I-3'-5' exonuclease and polymerase domains [Moritella viscosa]